MPVKVCRACGARSDHYTGDCSLDRSEETLYEADDVRYDEPMTNDERDFDEQDGWAEWQADAEMARWDDDPSPYDGTYSEE